MGPKSGYRSDQFFFEGATASTRLGAVAATTEEEADRDSSFTKQVERDADHFRGRNSKLNRNSHSETIYVWKTFPLVDILPELKKVLPFCDSQSVSGSGNSSSSYRVTKMQSTPSCETPTPTLGLAHGGLSSNNVLLDASSIDEREWIVKLSDYSYDRRFSVTQEGVFSSRNTHKFNGNTHTKS